MIVVDTVTKKYCRWIRDMIYRSPLRTNTYDKLINHLFHKSFVFFENTMDGNRFDDGISLRYRFGSRCGYDDSVISSIIDNRDCSVLEMMVALAIKMDNIMDDFEHDDRIGDWFWIMIKNLGIFQCDDDHFDSIVVEEALNKFMQREIDEDGSGGLFIVPGSTRMNRLDIWYQMHEFLKAYKRGDIII